VHSDLIFGNQLFTHSLPSGFGVARVGRLGDVVGGAPRQCFQRDRCAPFGESAEHDHRELGTEFPDPGERLEPVHSRHFKIECDQVGLELRNQRQRQSTAGGGPRNLDLRIREKQFAEHLANDHRIVNDQHPNRWHPNLAFICNSRPRSI
jgi:hypothetical protein